MGDNAAFTAFESIAVGLADLGVLSPKALDVVATAFSDTDIDRGGQAFITTRDGRGIDMLILDTKAPKAAARIRAKIAKATTERQEDLADEACYEAVRKIEAKWGWR